MILTAENNTKENRLQLVAEYNELKEKSKVTVKKVQDYSPIPYLPLWLELSSVPQQQKISNVPEGLEYSLTGFHNPRVHQGLSAEEFYKAYMEKLSHKTTQYHRGIHKWARYNRLEVIDYIRQRFCNTVI